jgi:hypothetical protein
MKHIGCTFSMLAITQLFYNVLKAESLQSRPIHSWSARLFSVLPLLGCIFKAGICKNIRTFPLVLGQAAVYVLGDLLSSSSAPVHAYVRARATGQKARESFHSFKENFIWWEGPFEMCVCTATASCFSCKPHVTWDILCREKISSLEKTARKREADMHARMTNLREKSIEVEQLRAELQAANEARDSVQALCNLLPSRPRG